MLVLRKTALRYNRRLETALGCPRFRSGASKSAASISPSFIKMTTRRRRGSTASSIAASDWFCIFLFCRTQACATMSSTCPRSHGNYNTKTPRLSCELSVIGCKDNTVSREQAAMVPAPMRVNRRFRNYHRQQPSAQMFLSASSSGAFGL